MTTTALFPAYYRGGAPLDATQGDLWFNIPDNLALAIAGIACLVPQSARFGAAVGVGFVVAVFGWYLDDLFTVLFDGAHPASGFWLDGAGYVFALFGAIVAGAYLWRSRDTIPSGGRRSLQAAAFAVLGVSTAVVAGVGDALPWDAAHATGPTGKTAILPSLGSLFKDSTHTIASHFAAYALLVVLCVVAAVTLRRAVGAGIYLPFRRSTNRFLVI